MTVPDTVHPAARPKVRARRVAVLAAAAVLVAAYVALPAEQGTVVLLAAGFLPAATFVVVYAYRLAFRVRPTIDGVHVLSLTGIIAAVLGEELAVRAFGRPPWHGEF